jgi:hypothetical protein
MRFLFFLLLIITTITKKDSLNLQTRKTRKSSYRMQHISHFISHDELTPGDHIYVRRFLYSHHGIYCGKQNDTHQVIHFSGGLSTAKIIQSSLQEFLKGGTLRKVRYGCSKLEVFMKLPGSCYTEYSDEQEVVLDRAYENLGKFEGGYSVGFFNCELFARFCKVGTIECDEDQYSRVTGGSLSIGVSTACGFVGSVVGSVLLGPSGAIVGSLVGTHIGSVAGRMNEHLINRRRSRVFKQFGVLCDNTEQRGTKRKRNNDCISDESNTPKKMKL